MRMMKKLKLFPSCIQNPKTPSFRATATTASAHYFDSDVAAVDTPESWFTTSDDDDQSRTTTILTDFLDHLDQSSSSLSISPGIPEPSYVKAVIRGAQQAGGDRLLFEPEQGSSEQAPRSVTVEMDSHNPKEDFRRSMEEMVESLGLEPDDWEGLEELLVSYFKVNHKSNHGLIFAAFVDLVRGFGHHVVNTRSKINDDGDDVEEREVVAAKLSSVSCFVSAASSSLSSSCSSSSSASAAT